MLLYKYVHTYEGNVVLEQPVSHVVTSHYNNLADCSVSTLYTDDSVISYCPFKYAYRLIRATLFAIRDFSDTKKPFTFYSVLLWSENMLYKKAELFLYNIDS